MKLLFVISQFYKGGAEVSLLNLLKRLDPQKYSTDIMIMNQSGVENAVSLVDELPEHIRVFDVVKEEKKRLSIKKRIESKLLLTEYDRSRFPRSALLFAQENYYDWAFHIGEWWSPEFVAQIVRADKKVAWIHNDLSEAEYFNGDNFFFHDSSFYKYIFVSKLSLNNSLETYPFIEKKSICVYNINDSEVIHKQAKDSIPEDYFNTDLPVLVTCANVRAQKNHMRQLKAMKILKDRGVNFSWINIGATTDELRCNEIKRAAKQWGLEDSFIFAGSRPNPYPYMAKADAVAVLSNYESWSMVITEAKILGVPVISTKTSGALEQIEDCVSGILTEFDEKDIADRIETFLKSSDLQNKIRDNIKNFDNTNEILESFYELLNEEDYRNSKEKELLYIIDDINYMGGAHIATKLQIKKFLEEGRNISVFSTSAPNVSIRNELIGIDFLSWQDFPENQLFRRRFLNCMRDSHLSEEEKEYKKHLTYTAKKDKHYDIFNNMVLPEISKLFSEYKTVCVMSESSTFRKMVADSNAKRKIQWIHTDYCKWKETNDWTRSITKNDEEIYSKFDYVVLLTENIREGFVSLYPSLEKKAVVNKNLLPVESILKKGKEILLKGTPAKFVTVSRIDYFKGFDRMYEALTKLYDEGYRLKWTIVGDGEALNEYKNLFANSNFSEDVKFVGAKSNPFPFVADADVFALLSRYEGIPNTIYEALILGVPAFSTNVGGVNTQITNGKNGWLVDNTSEAIYEGIKHILCHPEEIKKIKKDLESYHYDNDEIMANNNKMFFGNL